MLASPDNILTFVRFILLLLLLPLTVKYSALQKIDDDDDVFE
jgi:hypothetical protein